MTSNLYGKGLYTTRPSTAKKIDLDPISKRTINPEYNFENKPYNKPRKALETSNIMNINPLISKDETNHIDKKKYSQRPLTPQVHKDSQKSEVPQRRALK